LQQRQHSPKARFETSLLCRGKLGGNDEGGEAFQGLLDTFQAAFAFRCLLRGGALFLGLGPQQSEGRFHELPSVALVRHPVGGKQRQSFAQRQAVLFDAVQKRILIFGRQGTQGVGQRGADGSVRQPGLGC